MSTFRDNYLNPNREYPNETVVRDLLGLEILLGLGVILLG